MGEQRTILVTGGSAGIGAAVARAAAKRGWRIAIGARGAERLENVTRELAEARADLYSGPLDVSHEDSIEGFFGAAERALGPIDVIVNNAGHSRPGPLHERPGEAIASEIGTNLLGPLLVTKRALRSLLAAKRRGDIVFMSSDAVRRPRPGQLVYGATKAALENLAEGLAQELEGTGVRVTSLRVGPTLTEFGAQWSREEVMTYPTYWRGFGLRDARLLGALLSADAVAEAVIHAVSRPPGVWLGNLEIQPEAPTEGP